MSSPSRKPHNSHRGSLAEVADLEASHVRAQAAQLAEAIRSLHAVTACASPPGEPCPSCELDGMLLAFLDGLARS